MTHPPGRHGARARRPAATPMARVPGSPGPLLTAVVVLVLVVAAVLVQLIGGGATKVRAVTDQVRAAELVCPAPALRGAGTAATVTLSARPPGEDAPRSGSAVVSEVGGTAVPRIKVSKAGTSRVDVTTSTAAATVIRGAEGLAPGLAGELVEVSTAGPGQGLSTAACTAPASSAWFVGASTAAGRNDRLVLANPDAAAASVDLRFWDQQGKIDVPNSTDIAVPPNGAVSLPLEGMSAGHQRLAVQVILTRGQVAAALHDTDAPGIDVHGSDWMAPAPRPTRRVVIAGLPDHVTDRKLEVLVPGDTDGIVHVRLLGRDNDFAPVGADTLEVHAGQVGEYDLSKVDPTGAYTAVLTSDQPLVAAVRSVGVARKASDLAWSTAAAALTTPAAVPDARGGKAGSTRLLLAAPDGPVTVRVDVYTNAATPHSITVSIPANRTLVVDPGPKGVTGYSVVVVPVTGTAYGAVLLRVGTGLSLPALVPSRVAVRTPQAVPDVTAITAGRRSR
ncbi:MAG TPA: DUF5719 family protein [Sporichthyaceae bacterium]|jgi:hypothetical protein